MSLYRFMQIDGVNIWPTAGINAYESSSWNVNSSSKVRLATIKVEDFQKKIEC